MLQLIMTHLDGYKKVAIRSPLLIIIEVLCELSLPLLMSEIIDVAVPAGDTTYIFQLGGLMAVLALVAMFAGSFAARYAAQASQGFGANLRQALFAKVQDFSFADIDRFSSASLITRMTNDVNVITMMLSLSLRMLIRAPMMLIVALAVSIYLNAKLALVLVVILPLMMVLLLLLLRVCMKLFKTLQEKIDNLNSALQENLVAIRVVKAFVREPHERKKFKTANDDLTSAFLKTGMRLVAMMPLISICLNAAVVSALYFGGKMVMGDTFALGDLSAFITYITQVLMSVMMLGMALMQFTRAQACSARINEVLKTVPSLRDCETPAVLPPASGSIEFRDVSFRYQNDGEGDDVLSHISFSAKPGSFVALVGGTGTGKSSLVNLIPRFYDVSEGSVLVDNVDVRNYPLEELRRRIGMVMQTNLLFSGTVRENMLWGDKSASEEDIIRAAKDAQAYDFIMSLPDGFDTVLDQGGVNLSGGQKQRLCIARAMLKKPSILILDDSTSAVDSATEKAIRASFHENLKDTTVLIIAQRISSVQYADEIIVLDDGGIVGQGTHETLLAENEVYQEIYQSQQEEVTE